MRYGTLIESKKTSGNYKKLEFKKKIKLIETRKPKKLKIYSKNWKQDKSSFDNKD